MKTSKERFEELFKNHVSDRQPCICPGGMMNSITKGVMDRANIYLPEAHSDAKMMADLAYEVVKSGCFENFGLPFCMTVEVENMGARVDMGDMAIEPRVKEYLFDTVDDYDRIPNFELKGRAGVLYDAIRILKDRDLDYPIIGNVSGPISVATSLVEPTVFYKELLKKRENAHKFMERVKEFLIDYTIAQIGAGVDIIAISDPSGTGEILGPSYFEEFALKYLNELLDKINERGIPTIVHICGRMQKVFNILRELRCNVLSFDAIVSIKEAKEALPNHLIMGNVSTYSLEFAGTEKISSLTRHSQKSGADIIAPACGLGMRSPIENIQEILKTVSEG